MPGGDRGAFGLIISRSRRPPRFSSESVSSAWTGAYVDATPHAGDVAQWDPGWNGAGSAGHVAYVATVNSDGSVLHCGPMRDGEVHYRAIDGEPAVHEAINAGQREWRNIIVELKEKA